MKQCSLIIDLNKDFKKGNDNMITIQINLNTITINYFHLYKYSKLIQEKSQMAQEQLSQKIQEIKKKFNLEDENIITFFKILQEEQVEIKNDSLLDLFILSTIFKVDLLLNNLQKILPNFQQNLVMILTYLIEKNDEIKSDDIDDDDSIIKNIINVEMEKCLTNKINEIIKNKLFKKLPKCVIYRILEKSDPQNIPFNDLFSFIIESLDERFIFFPFLDIKNLTKENFDDLVSTYLRLKDSPSKRYFQYLSVDFDYIKLLKENEERIQNKLDNKTTEYNDNLNKCQIQIQNLENDNKKLLHQLDDLNKEHKETIEKTKQLENDNKKLLNQLDDLNKEHKETIEKTKQLENDFISKIEKLENDNKQLLIKLENLENDINNLQNKINVKQLVYFVIDHSGSMSNNFDQSHNRFDESKKFVCDFIKKSKELNICSLYGLILFTHQNQILCELTQNSEDFINQINKCNEKLRGGTALYMSIKKATDLLIKEHQNNQYPSATLRLIVFSDGEEVYSNEIQKCDILNYAILNNIRIDTILITKDKINDTIILSERTGCASFSPKNIDDGINFINQEAFLDPSKRIFKNFLPNVTIDDFRKNSNNDKNLDPEIIAK